VLVALRRSPPSKGHSGRTSSASILAAFFSCFSLPVSSVPSPCPVLAHRRCPSYSHSGRAFSPVGASSSALSRLQSSQQLRELREVAKVCNRCPSSHSADTLLQPPVGALSSTSSRLQSSQQLRGLREVVRRPSPLSFRKHLTGRRDQVLGITLLKASSPWVHGY